MLTSSTLQQVAKDHGCHRLPSRPKGFKGHNFMTDHVVGFYRKGTYDIELSMGEFMGDKLAGVTVMSGYTQEYDLSGCCFSVEDVVAKLEALK